jgi:hypothetical protein
MTLILGCLTPKYAIHVSDRYISKDGVTVDKNRNKGTVIRERFVMAYSGPDTIDGINTDIWLAKLLVQRSTTGRFWQDVLKEVQNATAAAPEP